jgi:hypothetical protein
MKNLHVITQISAEIIMYMSIYNHCYHGICVKKSIIGTFILGFLKKIDE